jgi:DNA processing protein
MTKQTNLFQASEPKDDEVFSPVEEITAYEALWDKYRTVPRMAKLFLKHEHALPSQVATAEGLSKTDLGSVKENLKRILPFHEYAALFYGDFDYPLRLREARNPIELLYYRGNLDLLSAPKIVSIVGARKASAEGILRARRMAKLLVSKGFVIMSGLAEGIDTAAHTAAIENGGQTIAVIGTPINMNYPKANAALQEKIAAEHLVVSQVPFYFYSQGTMMTNKAFFPERNITMSALSHASIIVEASDTSGTLYQARAAISQKRKLFILRSCFERGLTWPDRFLKQGAMKVETGEEVLEELEKGLGA